MEILRFCLGEPIRTASPNLTHPALAALYSQKLVTGQSIKIPRAIDTDIAPYWILSFSRRQKSMRFPPICSLNFPVFDRSVKPLTSPAACRPFLPAAINFRVILSKVSSMGDAAGCSWFILLISVMH